MKRKFIAILMTFVLAVSLAACGAGEETTLSGMVVSVDGTVISLVEMDSSSMGGMNFAEGEMPEMPEGMEGFEGFGDFENFDPGNFDGTLPEGETMPQMGEGETMPQMGEGETMPQWGEGEMPEMPGGMTPPDGMTMPENGEMPDFGGAMGEGMSGFGNFPEDMETKDVDIADAHISVEIDGGKASGTMEDVKAGTFVTITLNGKGEATYVLVSQQSFFGGRGN